MGKTPVGDFKLRPRPSVYIIKGGYRLRLPKAPNDSKKNAHNKVSQAIQAHQEHWVDPLLPFSLTVLGKKSQPYVLIFQWDSTLPDSLLILEWVFLSHEPGKKLLPNLK